MTTTAEAEAGPPGAGVELLARVELAISRLRKKLEGAETGTSLETIRGVGYMLRESTA